MPNATITNKVEEARRAHADAQQRVRELAQEEQQVAQDLRDAVDLAAAQRAEAARAGESTFAVAADLDTDALRQRKEQLPLQLWAARVAEVEAELAKYEAEDELALAEGKEAKARWQAKKAEHERVTKELRAVEGDAFRDRVPYITMLRRGEAQDRLKQLQGNYPGA